MELFTRMVHIANSVKSEGMEIDYPDLPLNLSYDSKLTCKW